MDIVIYILVGVVLGGLTGWLFAKTTNPNQGYGKEEFDALQISLDSAKKEMQQLALDKAEMVGRLDNSIQHFKDQKRLIDEKDAQLHTYVGQVQRLEAEKAGAEKRLAEQKAEVEKLNERFKLEFQQLAGEILKQNTKEFTDSNKKQIGDILSPLREKIESFEKRVNDVHANETQQRSELLGQVKSLMELNKQVSIEANNLSNALRGDTKKQGSWGELILEKILESSGLEKGIEYEVQPSSRTDDGIYRPDVIVKLPENKMIIIDAKVSLTAYDAYVNAEDDESQKRFLSQHLSSLRQHVKLLSAKGYQSNVTGDTLDFVLMFVPVESGFIEALKNDRDLFNYAWDARIVIVSPTTLLATLRTVATVWKQEKQSRNVQEIARLAGSMYDKFVGFIDDMNKVDRQLNLARTAHQDAMNKLSTGKGNLVTTAQKVRTLGAKNSKELPLNISESEMENESPSL